MTRPPPSQGVPPVGHADAARLIGALAALTALSNFHRASLAVIAPELSAELGLDAAALGVGNGAFFAALGLMQIPVGLLFDRIGARATVAGLSIVAVAGALWHATATDAAGIVAARFVLGIGCAASFMSAVYLCSRWFGPARLASTVSRVFAFSQAGTLAAGTPLAAASGWIGWRGAYLVAAALTALAALAFHLSVRDDPPGRPPPPRRPETARAILGGLAAVLRTRGLGPVLAMHCFAYSSAAVVLTLWAGPYLAEVHGLGPVGRGNVMLAMALAQATGTLLVGPLDARLNTRKWIVVPMACGTLAILSALAIAPAMPTVAAIALLILLCGVTTYSVVTVSHGRSLFPEHLAGRGVTTVNLAQVTGAAILPVVTGGVVERVGAHATGSAAAAYGAGFAVIALCLGVGLAVYVVFARDKKPNN
ncbi:MFS transporter [Elioraea rosea]|uniref:MFS transporter n=1 Tax=Elioraea rosea TaxID=2492390 RepID=UPI0013152CB7|nr:MFS transporter [Elioraea rosea]